MAAPSYVNGTPAVGPSVLSLTEARKVLSDQTAYSGLLGDDATVQRYIDSATRVVEGLTGPLQVQQLSITTDGGGTAIGLPWPVLSAYDMTLTLNGGASLVAGTDYLCDAANGMLYRPSGFIGSGTFANSAAVFFQAWAGKEISPGVAGVKASVKSAVAEELRFLWQVGQQGAHPAFDSDQGAAAGDFGPDGWAIPHRVYELVQFERGMPGFA